jgi:hypothetical protein
MRKTNTIRKSAIVAFSLLLYIYFAATSAPIPTLWTPRGVGGGGSLFSPSINPADTNEFYVACDMSELFHTTDFGLSYETMPFHQIQGATNSSVRFTSNPLIRYCISYANDIAVPVKSTDGGTTWSRLAGNPDESEETYGIWVDYDHPDRVMIAFYGEVYFSSNGGTKFTSVHTAAGDAGALVGGVLFSGDTIIAGTNDGLLVSQDGGAHFNIQPVSGIASDQVIASFAGAKQGSTIRLLCLTANSGDVYVGIPGSDYYEFMKGVYSLDWGTTGVAWTSRMSGIASGSDFPMYIVMAANNINVAYLGGSCEAGTPLVLKTVNAGASWTSVFNAENNQNIITGWSGAGGDRGWGYGECLFGIAVCPTNANKLVISDMGFVHVSADGGASWRQAYAAAEDQHPAGASTPKRKYYHSIGMENTSCWQVLWSDSTHLFAAFTDIGGARSIDAGKTWSFDFSGYSANTMYRMVKGSNGTLYAGSSTIHDMYQSTRLADAQLDANDANGAIIYSTDQGASWQTLHAFNHPVFWITLDAHDPNTMYTSVIHSTQGGVFVSHNIQNLASSTWTRLPAPPRTEGHPACIVSLADSSIACTYSGRRTSAGFTASSGTFVYKPSTGAWTDVSDAGMHYWTKDIIVDPFDATQNTWYVCVFSGWGGAPNGLGGIYKTTNRGASWTRISDLDRVTSLTFNPADHSEAYITTETSGLWHSATMTAAAPAFARVDNYPFRQPERVFYNPYSSKEIWVTSFGNGMRSGIAGGSPLIATAPVPSKKTLIVYYAAGKLIIRTPSSGMQDQRITLASVDGKTRYCFNNIHSASAGACTVDARLIAPGVYVLTVGKIGKAKIVVAR